jgi:XapX domain-containing protein
VEYKEMLVALLAGLPIGFLYSKLNLPAPAPISIAGVLGILGITLGYLLGKR